LELPELPASDQMVNFGTDRTVVPIELVTYATGQIKIEIKDFNYRLRLSREIGA
jgi:hypothetical protein